MPSLANARQRARQRNGEILSNSFFIKGKKFAGSYKLQYKASVFGFVVVLFVFSLMIFT